MKIAYTTTYDANDGHKWSGLGKNIFDMLKKSDFEVENVGNLRQKKFLSVEIKAKFHQFVTKKVFLQDWDPTVLSSISDQINGQLFNKEYDIIFSPGTYHITKLKTNTPIIFWADATFAGMIGFYQSFSNLCDETIRSGLEHEQAVLSKCSLAIYASDWAAKSAIDNYHIDPLKVKVVPFGANFTSGMDEQEINLLVKNKSFTSIKLLFIGVDWHRKGGDKALKIASTLNKLNIKTELNIVGCHIDKQLPEFVVQHGFISKKTEEGRQKLRRLFLESHFFILPSEAEAFGVVFAEASSFGLPSLTTNIGGIPSAVRDGINGKLFELTADVEDYCDYIQSSISSTEKYRELALSSFHEFEERLNWDTSGKIIQDLLSPFVPK